MIPRGEWMCIIVNGKCLKYLRATGPRCARMLDWLFCRLSKKGNHWHVIHLICDITFNRSISLSPLTFILTAVTNSRRIVLGCASPVCGSRLAPEARVRSKR
jgi:hypothetical protein